MKSLFYLIKAAILSDMRIVFSHISALECTRASNAAFLRRQPASRGFALPERLPSSAEIAEAVPFANTLSAPRHVMASRETRRRRTSLVAGHSVGTASLPHGSILFVRSENELFAASPELLFPQIGTLAHRVDLIRIGYELCGSYALSRTHPDGFYARNPLTTVPRMQSYLERIPGVHGTKAARWALQHVLPRSASPRETDVSMLFELPCALGGCGFGQPRLNHEVAVLQRIGATKTRKTYRIDLYWPAAKLGLEYDSDLAHTGAGRIARDARRRNDLESVGITMLTITNKQVKSLWEFNKLAHVVAGRLGKQIQPRCKDYAARQRELHTRLMRQGL